MSRSDLSPFRLLYGRGRVMERFMTRLCGERAVQQLVWVSPWMTHFPFLTGDTHALLRDMDGLGAQLTVITRPPDDGPHRQFVGDICEIRNAEVFYLADLHAKYYLCHTPRTSYAMVTSSNFYKWTARTFELGVSIEARGHGSDLIAQLDTVTIELKTAQTRIVKKRRGQRSL